MEYREAIARIRQLAVGESVENREAATMAVVALETIAVLDGLGRLFGQAFREGVPQGAKRPLPKPRPATDAQPDEQGNQA